MGRKGAKHRGRKGGRDAERTVKSSGADVQKLVNKEKPVIVAVAGAAAADALECMPWNRWKTGAVTDHKQAHAELAHWKEEEFGNPLFEDYYKTLGIVGASEMVQFLKTLARPLPVTVRINPLHPQGLSFLRRLRNKTLGCLAQARVELREWKWRGKKLDFLAREVAKLPKGCIAWELGIDRAGLKIGLKRHAELRALAEASEKCVAVGAAARQEVVSMAPVAVLQACPGDRVLDMCAAPGSKSSQLLEAVRESSTTPSKGVARGLVVANDAGVHERMPLLKRVLGSRPLSEQAGLVLTGALGEQLPLMHFEGDAKTQGCFDKVLADVPCSGDGTIRKAADVLRCWTPEAALQLHSVQVELALHGLRLLKIGGTMVYSTCSLNPIEDESVVASVLRQAEGSVALLDISDRLGMLSARPGLSSWQVGEAKGHNERGQTVGSLSVGSGLGMKWHSTFASAQQAGMSGATPGMWPPLPAEAQRMNLDHCRRVLPHDNDTGGFFLALFEKRGTVPVGKSTTACAAASFQSAPSKVITSLCSQSPGLKVESLHGRVLVSPQNEIVAAPLELPDMLAAGWPVISAGATIMPHAKEPSPLTAAGLQLLAALQLLSGKSSECVQEQPGRKKRKLKRKQTNTVGSLHAVFKEWS